MKNTALTFANWQLCEIMFNERFVKFNAHISPESEYVIEEYLGADELGHGSWKTIATFEMHDVKGFALKVKEIIEASK